MFIFIFVLFKVFVLVILSAHVKGFSVSYMHDFSSFLMGGETYICYLRFVDVIDAK